MTTIPWDWLRCEILPAEVEADLAELGAPELWLRQWRAMLDRMVPGDELWEYWGTEFRDVVEVSADEFAGLEQVVDADALKQFGLWEPVDQIIGFRAGFAVICDDAVIDWIEAPPSIA